MTLLIPLLLRLTTLFERGIPAEEIGAEPQQLSEGAADIISDKEWNSCPPN